MPEVYGIFNRINGKLYIGVTKHTANKRWHMHTWASKNKPNSMVISKAISKYGVDSFFVSCLKEFDNYNDALQYEVECIEKYNPEYNTAPGGNTVTGVKWSSERREKTINSLKKSWDKERKIKQSATMKGRVPRAAIDASIIAKKDGKKPVVCLNDGMEFPGIISAAKYYNVSASSIGEALNGRMHSPRGSLFFSWKSDLHDDSDIGKILEEKILARQIAINRVHVLKEKRVVNLDTGESWQSTTIAAKALGVSPSLISMLCKNGKFSQKAGGRMKFEETP